MNYSVQDAGAFNNCGFVAQTEIQTGFSNDLLQKQKHTFWGLNVYIERFTKAAATHLPILADTKIIGILISRWITSWSILLV